MIPAFTPTKEVASATVTEGVITMQFATGIGTGVDGIAITFTPSSAEDQTAINWTVDADKISNAQAKTALTKNNIAAASAAASTPAASAPAASAPAADAL
jgi:type IV pilus assembly protein PilA